MANRLIASYIVFVLQIYSFAANLCCNIRAFVKSETNKEGYKAPDKYAASPAKKVSESGGAEPKTAEFLFNQASGSAITITRTDGDITCVISKGSATDNPNEHSDGHLRFYGQNTLTMSGTTITSIEFTTTSAKYNKSFTANVGTYTKGLSTTSTWTGSAKEVVLTNSEAAQARIKKIVVTYE